MPHQDKDDLRTPLHELTAVFEFLHDADLDGAPRHGNATVGGFAIGLTAILTFGWNQGKNLSQRFTSASGAATRVCTAGDVLTTRQGLFAALAACGESLVQRIRNGLVSRLQAQEDWLIAGRPSFAVDGSQFAVPRTKQNLQRFAAASRKSKAKYKKKADLAKAKTTQIALLLCMHLGSSMPFAWNTGGSSDSERGLLLDLLDRLPDRSRLVMDAYYFGHQFWSRLIAKDFTFVVRAGSNVNLLKDFRKHGKVKIRNGLVFYWPQTVIDAGDPPIVLRLVEVLVGRKKMFLLTNELDLTDAQLQTLYASRWGVEVFFRTVKQSYEHAKLECRTPENALIEIEWTLLGIWIALTEAKSKIPPAKRISPIQVLRVVSELVRDVARYSSLKMNLSFAFSTCTIADESNRKSDKNSPGYPRKKKKREIGDPIVSDFPKVLEKLAIERLG